MKLVLAFRFLNNIQLVYPFVREMLLRGHEVVLAAPAKASPDDPRQLNGWVFKKIVPATVELLKTLEGLPGKLVLTDLPHFADARTEEIQLFREWLGCLHYDAMLAMQSAYYPRRWRRKVKEARQKQNERGARWLWQVFDKLPEAFWGPLKRSPKLLEAVARRFEAAVPVSPALTHWLQALKPDVVMAFPINRFLSTEGEVLKAARQLGIHSAMIIATWDNLTTKGRIHIKPDLIMAWNPDHRQEAIDYHGMAPAEIVMTGSPFFEKWLPPQCDSLPEYSINDLSERLGVQLQQPYLFYLGSSTDIAPNEADVILDLHAALQAREATRHVQLLIRPNPTNDACVAATSHLDNVVSWPSRLVSDADESALFKAVTRHSLGFCAINTSGMIDGLLLDVPGAAIIDERYNLTQRQAMHFQSLMKYHALAPCETSAQFAQWVADRLAGNPDPHEAARKRFPKDFANPYPERGTPSAQMAMALEALTGTGPTEQVNSPVAMATSAG